MPNNGLVCLDGAVNSLVQVRSWASPESHVAGSHYSWLGTGGEKDPARTPIRIVDITPRATVHSARLTELLPQRIAYSRECRLHPRNLRPLETICHAGPREAAIDLRF